ncbi:Acetyltransf_3 domain-containing protein [Cinnamomum micranthum f. kanehirae]|uniref:Acetyltransf_3 domain-containing protein n=1 Tax=Cinnamomum micranthum f. kanehirae TaxID=337451 RepID=A0A3S3P8E4_9MAGN|nr:Acetyltransf_3 domain-containing protein [Cinnamomum micranthum f. kanehirae]
MEQTPLQATQEEEKQSRIGSITLRPFHLSDIDDFMVWVTDDRVSRFCTWDTYTNREDALNYLKEILSHPWYRAICIDGRPIGAISIAPGSLSNRCRGELGYVLSSKYWGQGIATVAVKMVINTIFSEWPHLERLEAIVDVDNLGSQRVLEKAGFLREGLLRKYFIQKGRTRDALMFGGTRAEIHFPSKGSPNTPNKRYPKKLTKQPKVPSHSAFVVGSLSLLFSGTINFN